MADWATVLPVIADQGIPVTVGSSPRPVGGGDISDAWRVDGPKTAVFLKTAPRDSFAQFSGEADGLIEIAATGSVRVPRVLGCGEAGPIAWLALEWLDLRGVTADTEQCLGRQLARMHRSTAIEFGWHRDNTIGSTPQINTRSSSWASFYARCRLGYQLKTAERYGYGGELQKLGGELLENVDAVFGDHRPPASLLHGDLWAGNHAVSAGQPVIFDPAVYYGDRETDLAMTRLFGGFGKEFYVAYQDEWPLPRGYEMRVGLYQLYHVLNHLNLFGRGYLDRSVSLIRESLQKA